MKPAHEPICVARRARAGTVAATVLAHGTGALNIDASRVAIDLAVDDPRLGGKGTWASDKMAKNVYEGGYAGMRVGSSALGRWPANVIHDGSAEVLRVFPETSSGVMFAGTTRLAQDHPGSVCYGTYGGNATESDTYGDRGSAARFFYCAKASQADRGDGNNHPTVKPSELMRYLVRLVTPPGGVVLDPFAGSGSTGLAAAQLNHDSILIELNPEYAEMSRRRIQADAPLLASVA